jgi:eukaryotic-like serine/threonine-protein kinase
MKAGPAKSCPSCGERYDTDVLFCPRDGTPLATSRNPMSVSDRDPYIGVELPGQIRLDHLIGIGSMGRVYRAFQGGIERDVAVKVLHRELSGNPELVNRFHREAKVASRLVHPNVVQVLMTGALPQSTDARTGGELYLVMEHLDGISLLSALAAAGTSGEGAALPLARALHITLQICDAVGEAHAQGIVHRDIKPENVMLVRRGDDPDYAKVLDFGIARLDWADRGMATQAGLIFGTAKYISPEGAEGHPVSPPADVYSIATMLYQMLAGRTPFEGDSPVALLVQHSHAPPAELRTVARASYVPAPLAATIMVNLSKKPAERAQNARLLAKDLVAAARASGLYPEELATQSTIFSPASNGAVKLVSKERTRAHELSAELAAKIGGVAARTDGTAGDEVPQRLSATPAPTLSSARMGESPETNLAAPETTKLSPAAPASVRPISALPPPLPLAAATRVDLGDEALDDDPASTVPGAPLGVGEIAHEGGSPLTTMQGTETTLDGPASRPRRARVARLVAIVACVLVATPILVLGGRKLGGFDSASASSDTLDGALEEARDCMRRRAWDAPPGHNFKDVTDGALARWHDSAALADLRREAAEKLVADALGRKYTNDIAGATHLVDLALHFDPQLAMAQHLAVDLAGARSPDVAPAATSSASAERGSKSSRHGRDARAPETRPDPRAPQPPGVPPPVPSPRSPPSSAPVVPGGAVLPPPPAPHPPGDAPAPQPTGPWL